VYEIVKTIYSTTATDASEETRISVIQSTLGQLRLANIATLDAITTHFTRLIELTSADESYISTLAQNIAPCILRPRQESSLTMNERFAYRLLRDLFAHKEAIFGELKRASSLTHTNSGATRDNRPRAISTDESNRRVHMEERARAIAAAGGSRSRASSPAPSPRPGGHRRDRSSGGPETRFPIQTSPTETRRAAPQSAGAGARHSLEVPGSHENSPVVSNGPAIQSPVTPATANGIAASSEDSVGVEKRNSLGRSGAAGRFPRATGGPASLARQNLHRDSIGSETGSGAEEVRPRGVQLEDKPMDD
jgi:hypothetical protein